MPNPTSTGGAVNTDFRISVSFPRHPKTVRLIEACGGAAGPWCLVCLWAWASEVRCKGDLTGLSDDQIETVAGWKGDKYAFVLALVEAKFLDGRQLKRRLHNWEQHQPWASTAEFREERARKGGIARHNKQLESSLSKPEADQKHSAPSPSPSPSPRTETSTTSEPLESADSDKVALARAKPKKKLNGEELEHAKKLAKVFDNFYFDYPRKVGKLDAWKAFQALDPDRETILAIADDIDRRLDSGEWQPDDPERARFIKHPGPYLRGRMWEDGRVS